jgi:hypothetical protein
MSSSEALRLCRHVEAGPSQCSRSVPAAHMCGIVRGSKPSEIAGRHYTQDKSREGNQEGIVWSIE